MYLERSRYEKIFHSLSQLTTLMKFFRRYKLLDSNRSLRKSSKGAIKLQQNNKYTCFIIHKYVAWRPTVQREFKS